MAASFLLTIYTLWLLVALFQRPYFDGASNALNIAASLACTVNAIMLLLAHHGQLDDLSQTGEIPCTYFRITLPTMHAYQLAAVNAPARAPRTAGQPLANR